MNRKSNELLWPLVALASLAACGEGSPSTDGMADSSLMTDYGNSTDGATDGVGDFAVADFAVFDRLVPDVDGAMPDLAVPDLTAPDLTMPDLTMPANCMNNVRDGDESAASVGRWI